MEEVELSFGSMASFYLSRYQRKYKYNETDCLKSTLIFRLILIVQHFHKNLHNYFSCNNLSCDNWL